MIKQKVIIMDKMNNKLKIGLLVSVAILTVFVSVGLVDAAIDVIAPEYSQSAAELIYTVNVSNDFATNASGVRITVPSEFTLVDCGTSDWSVSDLNGYCEYTTTNNPEELENGAVKVFEITATAPIESGVYTWKSYLQDALTLNWGTLGSGATNVDDEAPNITTTYAAAGWYTTGDIFETNVTVIDDMALDSCWIKVYSGEDLDRTHYNESLDCGHITAYNITVGPSGYCQDEGRDQCKVEIGASDVAGNVATAQSFTVSVDLTHIVSYVITGNYSSYNGVPLFRPADAVTITTEMLFDDGQSESAGVSSCYAIVQTCNESALSSDECWFDSLSSLGDDCDGTKYLPSNVAPESLPEGVYYLALRVRNEVDGDDGDSEDFDDEEWAFIEFIVESEAPEVVNYIPFDSDAYYVSAAKIDDTFIGAKICDLSTGINVSTLAMDVDGTAVADENLTKTLLEDGYCYTIYTLGESVGGLTFDSHNATIYATDNASTVMDAYTWDFDVEQGYSYDDHDMFNLSGSSTNWYFVSMPVSVEEKDIDTLLRYTLEWDAREWNTGDILEIWTYEDDEWLGFINDDNSENDDFDELEEERSYWIKTDGDVYWNINGESFSGSPGQSPELYLPENGWNVVGFTSLIGATASEYFGNTYDNIVRIVSYESGAFCNTYNATQSDHILDTGIGYWVLFDLEGDGYWSNLQNKCSWV